MWSRVAERPRPACIDLVPPSGVRGLRGGCSVQADGRPGRERSKINHQALSSLFSVRGIGLERELTRTHQVARGSLQAVAAAAGIWEWSRRWWTRMRPAADRRGRPLARRGACDVKTQRNMSH